MASPPNISSPKAMSPPYPSPAQMPNRKRSSSTDTASNGGKPPAVKRRKASQPSLAPTHPLRQTSFPPEPRSRSQSVDDAVSHVSGSAVSGSTAAAAKRKRARRAKTTAGKNGNGSGDQASSVAGGGGGSKSAAGATMASGQGGDKGAAGDNDDEDDDDQEMALEDVVARTQEQKQEEIRLRAMLVEAFDSEQYNRYELWRAAKLSDAVVKRVVNATVSQSVPQMVSTAVKAVTKLFAGELIETARELQAEWIRAGEKQSELPEPTLRGAEGDEEETERDLKRGPLRPDHLRAAWLRYRESHQSKGVGMQQLWHSQHCSGVERFSSRTRKQIFK